MSEVLQRQIDYFSAISQLVERINDFPLGRRLEANDQYARLIKELASENFAYLLQHVENRFISNDLFDLAISNSLHLSASIRVSKNSQKPLVKHHLGTYFALADLTARLCSNKNFISYEFGPDNQAHQRQRGPMPMYARGPWLMRPKIRYIDYTPTVSKEGEFAGPIFCTGIPLESPSHFHLASLMLEVAVAWIQRHEQHHFALGHFQYSSNKSKRKVDEKELSTEDMYGDVSLESKMMELDADYNASRDVITEYFFDEETIIGVSEYFKFPKIAILRVILQSIFMVIIIFDKARQNATRNFSGSHPAPITRILNVMRALYQEFNELVNGPEMSMLAGKYLADREYSWIINASFEHAYLSPTLGEVSKLLAADISIISNVVSWEDGDAEGLNSYRHYLQNSEVALATFGNVRPILNAVEKGLLSDDFDGEVDRRLQDANEFQEHLMYNDRRQISDRGSLAQDAAEYAYLMKSWYFGTGVKISNYADKESPVLKFPTVRWINRYQK